MKRMLRCSLCLMGAILISTVAPARSQPQTKAPADRTAAGQTYFTDVVLLNQNGQEMRFYSDLIKGKVVIMIPFFTTCTSICPPMNKNLQRIQDWLGDRLGKQVHMMSISVDPEYDTPPRLKAYANRYKAKPGWYFLSGKKQNVDLALKKIGQYVDEKDSHSSVMIVGNDSTGLWKKAQALAKIDELIPVVESVLKDPGK